MEKNKTNYSTQEKEFLLALINKNKHIIENKKTDAVTNIHKNQTWNKIALQFNSNFQSRTPNQLKKCWDNIKTKTRKSDTKLKQEELLTGGGPPPKKDNDDMTDLVRSIVPSISLEVENYFDSNTISGETLFKRNQNQIEPSGAEIELCEMPIRNPETRKGKKTEEKRGEILFEQNQNQIEVLDIEKEVCETPIKKLETKKGKKSGEKRAVLEYLEDEKELRIKKLKESILQQREIHELKAEVIKTERKYWEKMLSKIDD